MSLIDEYNKGKIDAVELNRRLEGHRLKRKTSRNIGYMVTALILAAFALTVLYINHKWEVSQECQAKYQVYSGDQQINIEAKLELQKLCREGKD
ncbi:hypothetical protein OMDBNIEC_00012 [Salmonella phage STP-SP5]|nr:hypothetical protein OMDBNIEC_00012 [Salmonella phage STP-SP5]